MTVMSCKCGWFGESIECDAAKAKPTGDPEYPYACDLLCPECKSIPKETKLTKLLRKLMKRKRK